jgi:hypothetical protein
VTGEEVAKAGGTRWRGAANGAGPRRRAAAGAGAGRRTAARTVREAAPRHAMARVWEVDEEMKKEVGMATAAEYGVQGFKTRGLMGRACATIRLET